VKKTVAVVVAITFVLAFATPVFAQDMTHSTEYKMDGSIDLEKQVGHLCNTGAEMKQVIEGEGEMTKVMDTSQVAGVLTVTDDQDWVTAEDAVRNLTVTSAIELCAPPKTVYGGEDDTHEDVKIPIEALYFADNPGDEVLENVFDPDEFSELTDQIWAVQVEADPGFSGGLAQDFEAAYGPWAQHHGQEALGVEADEDTASDHWWFVDEDGDPSRDEEDIVGTAAGDDYVGNYFNIDQFARTSQGTTQRYIDISSPWSGAYLYEDMTVVGTTEIDESFAMDNLEPGAEAVPDWWDLF